MKDFKTVIAAAIVATGMTAAYADGHATSWTLDPALSNVSFGSIKNDAVGEAHSFGDVSGSVDASGAVTIELSLASVNTNIDIRNDRMIDHVFKNAPTATVTAQIDMTDLAALDVGAATTVETEGTLSLLGTDTDLDARFFIMRVSEEQVLVITDGMVMLSTEDAGIDGGIDVLQQLASLDSITRVSPITMRLFFNAGS